VYFGRHDSALVLLLSGGDKASQSDDIRRAKEHWSNWKRRQM
jgi:putative addiction module killer protein